MKYNELDFKKPTELFDYKECSDYVIKAIKNIMELAIDNKQNRIIINTNLRLGLPMENINKIAGLFVEAWAHEIFVNELNNSDNKFKLVNVEAFERLNMADVILQFKRERKTQTSITANIDVKATARRY